MEESTNASRSLMDLLAGWRAAAAGSDLPQPPDYDGPDVWLTHLTEKTTEVTPGACFVARVRETSDGHPYIGLALENGAAMILGQRPLEAIDAQLPERVVYLQVPDTAVASAWLAAAWEGFPSRQLLVIGITGTDGKTTTANILLSILRAAGFHTGLLSTTRAVIGRAEEPLALHVTTPEAPIIQRHLRRMVDAGLTHCILETTSHGLAQQRVGAVDFDVAVVTNITHEHLDYHGNYKRYLAAKARLFRALSQGPWPIESSSLAKRDQVKTAILNHDDSSYKQLAAIPTAQQFSYAIHTPADITAADIQYQSNLTRFTLHVSDRLSPAGPIAMTLWSPLTGEFNVYNTLAASGAALAAGAGADAVAAGLAQLEPIDGRMERIDLGQPFTVIVDFAHTPNALIKAIEAARCMTEGRVITIFGSAGKRDVEKRYRMAAISAELADLTVLTAEDPRTDSLDGILQSMADGSASAGGVEGQTFWRVRDRGRAIHFGLSLAGPGDLVLICGKGHEQSMCFGTIEFPWDDRRATKAALEALAKGDAMPDLGLPTFNESSG